MNPFDVKLFDMLPEMPQPLALAVLVCLAVLTIGHLIFRVRLVMTKGFALQHEIPTVVEMIESGKSYTDIMAFMREHERGSKDPIVSATYSMVCHALQGMDSFVGKMEECREMAKSQDHWYTRNKMFPSTIVFVVLLMTGTIACSSLPYSDMTWGLAWICAGYWGLIAAVRHFISFFGGGISRAKFWDVFSTLLKRLTKEQGKERDGFDRAPRPARVHELSLQD